MAELNGIILKSTGGFYYVEAANGVYECKARGIFRKKNNSPKVGDKVVISVPDEGYCSIEEILPRKNTLRRPPLSNIDILVIVVSTTEPAPNALVIDKMTAAAVDNDIEPAVVISKSDLKSGVDLLSIYKNAGIKAFAYSSEEPESAEEIKRYLKGKVAAFTGNSGVGKSTLLNILYPDLELQTGEISEKLGRGRHTTRTVELYKTDEGYVADTPGFSTVDLERYNMIDKDNIKFCFPEFRDFLTECQFTSCSHTCEKGCAVLKAVEEGKISESRHKSYVAMYNEVKDIKEWQKKQNRDA
ncbi:MAG: ribosome small subunit-dependent GTPase A [Ruminococcus sp.]|nr:ribosome small subunit-dependent GTPase A [Ruminococcus sp.]